MLGNESQSHFVVMVMESSSLAGYIAEMLFTL
jgi:hypothetical protein